MMVLHIFQCNVHLRAIPHSVYNHAFSLHFLMHARRWTITDTCVSPDQRFLLYASINPTGKHLINKGSMNQLASQVSALQALDNSEGETAVSLVILSRLGPRSL